MLNLHLLILIALISFSIQDKNCLVYFESCKATAITITITNCIYSDIDPDEKVEKCYECKNGYVPSYDRKSCISTGNTIEHCTNYYSAYENQLRCSECDNGYVLSGDHTSCNTVENLIDNCISYESVGEDQIICRECKIDYFRSYDTKSCIGFKNCDDFNREEKDNEYCERCKYGYALSYDGSECKQFENCAKLAKGDSKCSECAYFFHLNTEGICERTLCLTYENNICTRCFEGYYLDGDKNCKKITIENCLESDSKGEKCTKCIYDILPDTNGKCNLPLIKGCVQYGSDGKCTQCERKYNAYELKDGTCQFKECKEGEQKIEYCDECKAGYFESEDANDNDICIGYDGSMDTSSSDSSSSRNKVEYALLIFILALLN